MKLNKWQVDEQQELVERVEGREVEPAEVSGAHISVGQLEGWIEVEED